jgi:hypothetical protein
MRKLILALIIVSSGIIIFASTASATSPFIIKNTALVSEPILGDHPWDDLNNNSTPEYVAINASSYSQNKNGEKTTPVLIQIIMTARFLSPIYWSCFSYGKETRHIAIQ